MKPCPVCGGEKFAFQFSSGNRHGRHVQKPEATFSVVACEACGLMGLADVVADESYYQAFYPQGYHEDPSDHGFLARLWSVVARFWLKRKIQAICRFAKPKAERITLLDVGCGPGHFLSQLDRARFDPHGLEPVGEAVEAARKRGLDVFQGNVLVTPLADSTYDVVTLWHVLEHIDRPHVALARIHAALTSDGLIVITTPNTHSRACRIGKADWFHLDSPRHLSLFNERNLVQLLAKSGFEPVLRSWLPFDFPLDLYWSLRRQRWFRLLLFPFYPLLKCFDHENLLVIARKQSATRSV